MLTYLWQSGGFTAPSLFRRDHGVDSEIIEASEIDGANAFQRIILFAAVAEADFYHSRVVPPSAAF
ncbi:hypothetical protein ACFSL6_06700 [Paenibacillus thailandensis]|uniref:hypothetical protein n=1 Tax=Paenibacillus thailandensis TaxID=393250 RepID=UPI0036352516